MSKKNKKNSKKANTYLKIVLIILVIYLIGILYKVYLSHVEIKVTYKIIEENKIDTEMLEKEVERIIKQKENRVFSLDLKSDDSLTKFVNSKVKFENVLYIPLNLKKIKSNYINDTKGNQLLRKEAKVALGKLAKEFHSKFNEKIAVISAYRSYNYQQGIKNRGCPDNLCAKAGYSEHQTGLAVDLWEASTNKQFMSNMDFVMYFNWLNEYAHEYGFVNTYQKGLDIDGYEIEPWHWRYVGLELARHLKENNLTIAEFYNISKVN